MGLLDRFLNRVRIPAFTVSIYGKLPCYKEYFHASGHPLFAAVKNVLDAEFDRLIRLGAKRPYVCPDQRFYFRMDDPKTDLAGCIFESDDGLRGFPFIMAAPLPAKLCRRPFHQSLKVLEPLWQYLEAYFAHLREQPSSSDVYNRVVDVIHELEPVSIDAAPPSGNRPLQAMASHAHIQTLALAEFEESVCRSLADHLQLPQTPAMVLWPCAGWRGQEPDHAALYFGERGLADLAIEFFGENARQALAEPQTTDAEEATLQVKTPPGIEPDTNNADVEAQGETEPQETETTGQAEPTEAEPAKPGEQVLESDANQEESAKEETAEHEPPSEQIDEAEPPENETDEDPDRKDRGSA